MLQLVVTSFLVVELSFEPLASEPLAFTTLVSHWNSLEDDLFSVELEVLELTPVLTVDVLVDEADVEDDVNEEDDEEAAVLRGDLGSGVESRLSVSAVFTTDLFVDWELLLTCFDAAGARPK